MRLKEYNKKIDNTTAKIEAIENRVHQSLNKQIIKTQERFRQQQGELKVILNN